MKAVFFGATPVEILRDALKEAFPERADFAALEFDGSLAQAWPAFSRFLGIDELALARAVAPHYGIPAATSLEVAQPHLLARVPSSFCQSNNVLPLRVEDGEMVFATAQPGNANLEERARFLVGMGVRWALAPPQALEDAIVMAYAREAARIISEEEAIEIDPGGRTAENAIVKLGRTLLSNAIELRASDLHIQPFLGAFVVRIRVDGVMRRLTMLKDAVASGLIRHFKSRSGMESTNSLVPQDGRMALVAGGRDFDMRVSCLPASRGERLVIRFLDQGRVHQLGSANFSRAALQILRRAIARPAGMVIMTGPTGCGKTSTLYGMLSELNRSDTNIITVENPVEYRVAGISQVEVNEKAGRTFHAALRSILRQDPDVVLIGEIRDEETAEIAAQAALTGHLVLSTLHTNDALTAIPRLLNLKVQPTILADSLAVVVAQRLCRTLCVACRAPVAEPLTPEERTFLEVTHSLPGHRAVGCKACDYTGFRGRLPIVEIIEMNKGLRDAIALGESRLAELDRLREGGLKSLAASGAVRVISGDTTVSEVMAAVGPGFWPELANHFGTVCFQETIDLMQHVSAGQAVLLVGGSAELAAQLEPALEPDGLHLVLAPDPEAAQATLRRDEDIAFILFELPDDADLEAANRLLGDIRLRTSWTRLPALMLLPAALADREAKLRENDAISGFLHKPADSAEIVSHIRHARAR